MRTPLKYAALTAECALLDLERAAVDRHDPPAIELACIALLATRLLIERADELEQDDIDLDDEEVEEAVAL